MAPLVNDQRKISTLTEIERRLRDGLEDTVSINAGLIGADIRDDGLYLLIIQGNTLGKVKYESAYPGQVGALWQILRSGVKQRVRIDVTGRTYKSEREIVPWINCTGLEVTLSAGLDSTTSQLNLGPVSYSKDGIEVTCVTDMYCAKTTYDVSRS